jgi:hypothetical protein
MEPAGSGFVLFHNLKFEDTFLDFPVYRGRGNLQYDCTNTLPF